MLIALPHIGLQIRPVPLICFTLSAAVALFLGLVAGSEVVPINDKILHSGMFFLMSFSAYWIIDVSRRHTLQLISAGMLVASIGSEFAQSMLTTRQFDIKDIYGNLIGSTAGIA